MLKKVRTEVFRCYPVQYFDNDNLEVDSRLVGSIFFTFLWMSVVRILIGMPIIYHTAKKSTYSFSVCWNVISLTGNASDSIVWNPSFSGVLQQFTGFPEQSGLGFWGFFFGFFWRGQGVVLLSLGLGLGFFCPVTDTFVNSTNSAIFFFFFFTALEVANSW